MAKAGGPDSLSGQDAYTAYCECGAISVVSIGTFPIVDLRCPSCPTTSGVSKPSLHLIRGGRA